MASFPRKRESRKFKFLGPSFHGGDKISDVAGRENLATF
jgi:hypothetical protein